MGLGDDHGIIVTSEQFKRRITADSGLSERVAAELSGRLAGRVQTYADASGIELGENPGQWKYDPAQMNFVRNGSAKPLSSSAKRR